MATLAMPQPECAEQPRNFWTVDDDEWRVVEGSVRNKIAPGVYQLTTRISFGEPPYVCLKPLRVQTDRFATLSGSLAERIIDEVETFWKSASKYNAMGLIHKRGFLMEGKPGSGKTAVCMMLGKRIAERGGISILTMPNAHIQMLPRVLQSIREVEPDLPIVDIIEDIDCHSRHIDTLLPMLDGETQVNNILHIATTNFASKLDERLTNRPSRFDRIYKVKPPIKRARLEYLRMIFQDCPDVTKQEIELLADKGKGLLFAHLKELATCYHMYGSSPDEVARRLRAAGEGGFRSNDEDEEEDEE